jgi:hypothetical protein
MHGRGPTESDAPDPPAIAEPGAVAARVQLGWPAALAACLLLSLVALFAYAPIFAIDFFWHLKLGQIIAETGAIPRSDLFSAVQPERPYVQIQWLWEVLAYAAHRAGGLRGVRIMQVVCMGASFAILAAMALRFFRSRAYAFFFCALALVLFEDRFQTRPSATVLGFVACMLPLWLEAPRELSRRAALGVFLLCCLWSNLHGGESLLSVLGAGALAVGQVLELRGQRDGSTRVRAALLLLVATCLGVLASPTLLGGLRDWGATIQPQLATGNREWRPTYTMLENGFTPSFVAIALAPSLVAILYLIEQRRRLAQRAPQSAPPYAEWLLCGGLLVLSQQAVRNAFLCIVPLAFMLRRFRPTRAGERARRSLAGAALCLLLAAFQDHVVEGYGSIDEALALIADDLAPQTFPVETAAFMREAGIEGAILNDGRWGGYLIWELWPRSHVFVDSRHDLTPAMWPVFLASHSPGTRAAAMEEAFRRWGIGLSLFRGPTFALVRPSPDWQLLYKAGDQELYQRLGAPNSATNLARARSWLTAHAARPEAGADLTALALEVGAERWLGAPYQVHRDQRARQLLHSSHPADVQEGLSLRAELLFDAGRYDQALPLLQRLLARDPGDVKAAYKALLTALATGDQAGAGRWLGQLRARQQQLSAPQRDRLRAIERGPRVNP